jgi:hypothetical protein
VGPSDISAILAVMDLKLVRGLRAALQDDIQHGVHPLGPAPQKILPRKVHEPDPRIEPRKVVHPTPYFEPRPVHHPEPKFAPHEDLFPPSTSPLPEDPGSKCVIQPPWKVRPWETPVPTKLEVKVVQLRPDIVHKGTLIDFFC